MKKRNIFSDKLQIGIYHLLWGKVAKLYTKLPVDSAQLHSPSAQPPPSKQQQGTDFT